jgi:DNA-binding transcriptional regulator YiaG
MLDYLHYTVYNITAMVHKKQRPRWDGAGVRALRHYMKLTQAKLAEELGTRQQTISEWETGMYRPRGTAATLLTLVAERSGFKYSPHTEKKLAN